MESVSPDLIETIVNAMEELPCSKGLSSTMLEDIAREAVSCGKLQDLEWLTEKLEAVQASYSFEEEAKKVDVEISTPQEVETQEDFDRVVRDHQDWIDSVLNPRSVMMTAKRANLRGADLTGLNLRGVDLSCADLTQTKMMGLDLSGANFSRANLEGSDLQGSILVGTRLKGACLERANFREADLEGAIFNTSDLDKAIRL